MALRRNRKRSARQINEINMTPLIDLTFLLLITFIITMPAMEQGISVKLPQGRTDVLPKKESNVVTIDATGNIYFNNKPVNIDDLDRTLGGMAVDNPDLAVLVRGDERLEYGQIISIMKILYKHKITRMALVTLAD
jgi:biopolymer transport protein TolR